MSFLVSVVSFPYHSTLPYRPSKYDNYVLASAISRAFLTGFRPCGQTS